MKIHAQDAKDQAIVIIINAIKSGKCRLHVVALFA